MWGDGWQNEVCRIAGIPCTQTAITALTKWQQSTPVDSWTNNPLGLPPTGNHKNVVHLTNYCVFPTMDAFRQALKTFLATPRGRAIKEALINQDSYAPIWRAISSANLPAAKTESEYPAALLDMVEDTYLSARLAKTKGNHKSAGKVSSSRFDRTLAGSKAASAARAINSARQFKRGM